MGKWIKTLDGTEAYNTSNFHQINVNSYKKEFVISLQGFSIGRVIYGFKTKEEAIKHMNDALFS